MTVALVLAAEADAGLRDQLAALGVRRVHAAERSGPGLLTVAAAARAAAERVLICTGDDAVPAEVLAWLLGAGGTAAFTGIRPPGARSGRGPGRARGKPRALPGGALLVDTPDLDALAVAAESLAAESHAAGHSAPAGVSVLLGELRRRGVSVRVLDAGPDGDGAVARLIIDPAARDVASWADGRELTAGALYGISLGLGALSAVWFSEPATRAQAMAIAALLASFTADRAGTQLALAGAGSRVRPVVDWLGGACGLLTELAVYAALAVSAAVAAVAAGAAASGAAGAAAAGAPGAGPAGLGGIFGGALRHTSAAVWAGAGPGGVWRLAVAAAILLGARRLAELCYEGLGRASGIMFPRPARRLAGQVITLPPGERIAVIAVTAVLFGPRLTFLALLAWGAVATGYILAGQAAGAAKMARAGGELAAYRGDGPVAYRIGGLVRGMLPPLPPLLVGLLVTADLTVLGLANLPGVLVFTPVAAMLLAALGARHPHDGLLDWLVPALLLAGESVFLAALSLGHHVWLPVVFALVAAVVVRHADIAYRARSGRGVRDDAFGLGWDGRMVVAGLAAVAGIAPFAFAALAAWLWLLAGWDFLGAWLRA